MFFFKQENFWPELPHTTLLIFWLSSYVDFKNWHIRLPPLSIQVEFNKLLNKIDFEYHIKNIPTFLKLLTVALAIGVKSLFPTSFLDNIFGLFTPILNKN